jgi:hypothetical protein
MMATRPRPPWPSKCIFCGRAPVTDEHIFATEWIKSLRPGVQEQLSAQVDTGSHPVVHRYRSHGPDIVAKCVGDRCNSGWMNALDQRAQPVLAPLVSSLATHTITIQEQRVLATWATKIAMMLDWSVPSPIGVIKPSAHKRMWGDRLPPQEAFVWLAAGKETRPFLVDVALGGRRPPLMPSFVKHVDLHVSTFRINHAVFQVFVPDPGSGLLPLRDGFEGFVVQLWPLMFSPIVWPARKVFETDEGVRALAFSFGDPPPTA